MAQPSILAPGRQRQEDLCELEVYPGIHCEFQNSRGLCWETLSRQQQINKGDRVIAVCLEWKHSFLVWGGRFMRLGGNVLMFRCVGKPNCTRFSETCPWLYRTNKQLLKRRLSPAGLGKEIQRSEEHPVSDAKSSGVAFQLSHHQCWGELFSIVPIGESSPPLLL